MLQPELRETCSDFSCQHATNTVGPLYQDTHAKIEAELSCDNRDNSKMVIMGDVKQKDIRNKRDSSLEIVLRRFDNVAGFGCVELRDPNDVVRNPIIKLVEQVFDDMEDSNK